MPPDNCAGITIAERAQADLVEKEIDEDFCRRVGFAARLRSVEDILPGCHPGKQGRLLEDDKPVLAGAGYRHTARNDFTARRLFETRDEADQRALAGAGWSDHHREFVRLDGERAILDHRCRERAVAVRFAHVADDDLARLCGCGFSHAQRSLRQGVMRFSMSRTATLDKYPAMPIENMPTMMSG